MVGGPGISLAVALQLPRLDSTGWSEHVTDADDTAAATRRQLLDRLTRTGLYLITDDRLDDATLLDRLNEALAAGADVVQFRDKRPDKQAVEQTGRRVAEACRAAGALFIVNDDAELAVALDADGVHVG